MKRLLLIATLVMTLLVGSTVVASDSVFSDQLTQRINNAVVLKVDWSKAYVNGNEAMVDSTDKYVSPFITGNRTLVPVRFISESLGANVDWNDQKRTATISLNNRNVEMAIESNIIRIDGKEKEIDVPAQIFAERTFIPLRALVEALGKQVFWDDRGIIVISDVENIFDPVQDKALVDEIQAAYTDTETIGPIRLGMVDEEVLANLGNSSEKSESGVAEYDGNEYQTWYYKEKGIALDMVRDGNIQVVDGITIENPCSYKTSLNIGIGSTKDEVLQIYKNAINLEDTNIMNENSTTDTTSYIMVGSVYRGTMFKFDDDKVSLIFVGAGAE